MAEAAEEAAAAIATIIDDFKGLTLDRLHLFCQAQGIDHSNKNKDALCAYLQRVGLTANMVYKDPVASVPIGEQSQRQARLKMRKQYATEEIADFLKYAEVFFQLDHTREENKTGLLISVVTTDICKAMETIISKDPSATYDDVRNLLLDQNVISRFDRLTRFRQMKPAPGENILQFGSKIRATYLQYLLITEDKTGPMETAIVGALMEQLFDVIDPTISAHVKIKVGENPEMTWIEILKITENFRHTTTKTVRTVTTTNSTRNRSSHSTSLNHYCDFHKRKGGHSTAECFLNPNNPNKPPPTNNQDKFCEIHQTRGHSTDECRSKKYYDQPQSSSDTATSPTSTSVTCFNCKKPGHFTRNCPANTGNAGPGQPY
jgi:hypothetical protein